MFQVFSLVLYIRLLYSVSSWQPLRSDWSNTLCSEVVFTFHQLADLVKAHVLIHVESHNLISVLPPLLPSRSLDHPAGRHQCLLADLHSPKRTWQRTLPLDFLVKTSISVGENRILSEHVRRGRFILNCVHSNDCSYTERAAPGEQPGPF